MTAGLARIWLRAGTGAARAGRAERPVPGVVAAGAGVLYVADGVRVRFRLQVRGALM